MGIADPDNMSIEQVLSELANMATGEALNLRDSYKKALSEKNVGKRKQLLSELKTRGENSMLSTMANQKETYTQDFSDKIPVVSYNNSGEITSETISMAVPVWIVGQGGPGVTYEGDKDKAKEKKDEDSIEQDTGALYSMLDEMYEKNKKSFIKAAKKGKNRRKHTKAANLEDDSVLHFRKKNNNNTDNSNNNENENSDDKQEKKTVVATRDSNLADLFKNQQSVLSNIANTQNSSESAKDDKKKSSKLDLSTKSFNFKDTKTMKASEKLTKLKSYKHYVNSVGLKIWKDFAGVNAKVIPVFDVNKSHELSEQIGEKLYEMQDDVAAINAVVGQLPTMWSTLQEGGLTFNAAAAGGVTAMVGGIAGKATQLVGNTITQGSTKMATGGSMSGRTSSSTILTGDPRKTTPNKPNPELVSVNWRSKKIDVTPIPQFATGGSTNGNNSSNVSGISRMTSYERNKPMSVGISTGLITYSKTLSDVTDSGDKTAIKVYSINSGINEKIKVGDNELSLFDAVYGIYGTISTIAETVSSQSQIQSQIASGITALNSTAKSIAENMNNRGASQFEFTDSFDNMLRGE